MEQKSEELKLWLDFLKWFMVSVVISLVTVILGWKLDERNQGLSEIQQYDKHVDMIVQAENLEKRRLLAQFFSSVTVSEPLKKGWEDYYKTVNDEFIIFKSTKDSLESIILADTSEVEKTKAIDNLQKLNEKFEKTLVPFSGETSIPTSVNQESFVTVDNGTMNSNIQSEEVVDQARNYKYSHLIGLSVSNLSYQIREMEWESYENHILNAWKYQELAHLIHKMKSTTPVFYDISQSSESCKKQGYENLEFRLWTIENISETPTEMYNLWHRCLTIKESAIFSTLVDLKNNKEYYDD